jgi:hypothetical protein
MGSRHVLVLMAGAALAGCPGQGDRTGDRTAHPPVATKPRAEWTTVVLDDVPFVRQKPDFCGEACVEMASRRLGKRYDQDAVFAATGLDPALGRGAYTRDLVKALAQLGYAPGDTSSTIDAAHPEAGLDAAFAVILADLTRGVPTIVCTHFDERPNTTEHFRLVVGYDAATDEVVYHDPALDDGAYKRMTRARFAGLWPLKYDASAWTLVHLPLVPARLVDPPATGVDAFSPAAYAQHVMALREKLDAKGLDGLSIHIEAPFVVVGDGGDGEVVRRAKTVRWAADALEADFFATRPARILDVYLFGEPASYAEGTRALTGEEPTTPYGFYSSSNDALIMDISTGGGTLVHEIVHPYVEADFPAAPAWLNEGLGSLFEQSGERDGHIVGFTNWRLAGLQRAIAKGGLTRIAELAAMDDTEFYAEEQGTNYAQARYLLYYLQEKGRLREFYTAFRAARDTDPTGYKTLVATLGERDMDAFQARWETWVAKLRFP